MPKQLRSISRRGSLRRVFRSDEERLIDAYIARLCVLYEDLKIEILAISADSIPNLDVLDPVAEYTAPRNVGKYRRNYFLRRAIATLYEFAEGLRLLSECPDFAPVEPDFDSDAKKEWRTATDFFNQNKGLIKNVRNDIGGHFGSQAAIYAVPNLSLDAAGKIEIERDAPNGRIWAKMHFAGDIAAAALMRHLQGGTPEEQVGGFMDNLLVPGLRYATGCVHILAMHYLWPRFGR